MAKRRDASIEKYWRRTLRRCTRSRMTVAQFCESEGLRTTTYYHWQREIKRRDEEIQPLSPEPAGMPLLMPAEIVDDSLAQGDGLEVVARNGYVVRVGRQACCEQLQCVLRVVSQLD